MQPSINLAGPVYNQVIMEAGSENTSQPYSGV